MKDATTHAPHLSSASLIANSVSFIALAVVMFSLNAPAAFFRFDGTYLLSVAVNQPHWMAAHGVFSANPLSGNAGLWFPTATELIPGFLIGRLLGGDTMVPAVAFAWFATEFFIATVVLGVVSGLGSRASVIGAWIMALGICPFLMPTPASERVWGNPHLLSAVAVTAIAIAAFLHVGRHRRLHDFPLSLVVLTLLTYLVFSQPVATTMSWPVFAFFGLTSAAAAGNPTERTRKLLALAAILSILAAGFGPYLWGLFRYAKTTFFWNELVSSVMTWRQASFLLDFDSQPRWLGRVYWVTACAGAGWLALHGNPSARRVAIPFLVFLSGGVLVTLLVAASGKPWRGPVPAYVDLFAFPLYACFIGTAVDRVAARWASARRHVPWLSAVLPWLVLAMWRPLDHRPMFRNHVPFLWPPARTAVTDHLQREIGLRDGQPFRGRVVNLAGLDFSPDLAAMPFSSQHNYDAMTAFFTGNDQRMYGLWYFDIPTLIENTQFSSPYFHLLTSRLLAEPGIRHTRAQTTITRLNERVLRQFGVRYVIADRPLPHRTATLRIEMTPGREQFLYELEGANLGGVSPVDTTVVTNAEDAVARLADPAFDFGTEVVLLDALPSTIRMSAAKAGPLRFFRDHATISATSPGTSLLVLPVEFSHCIVTDLHDSTGIPRLFRANLTQLAVLFSGELRGSITMRYSPLDQPHCRLEDLTDAYRHKLGARSATPPL